MTDTSPSALRKLAKTLYSEEDLSDHEEALLTVAAEKEAQPRPTDDELWDDALSDRDRYHDIADKLANAIAAHLGIDIGEHSNLNCPWLVALEALEQHHPEQPLNMVAPAHVPLPEPLFLLHCGALYNGEQDDWEVEANSGRAVDALAREHPNKTVWLHSSYDAHQYAEAYAEAKVAAERERLCAAIKAADDLAVSEADYMLDSNDCIKVIRGTWVFEPTKAEVKKSAPRDTDWKRHQGFPEV